MNNSKLNPYFQQLEVDHLYHFGLDSTMDLPAQFGSIKYVILTRSFHNADLIANEFIKQFYKIRGLEISSKPLAKDERYHLYKVDNTLIVSHGIGAPSLLICLNEIVKLLWHSRATAVKFFRVSPAGGLGVEPGSLVIATEAVNHALEARFDNIEFATTVSYPTQFAVEFSSQLVNFARDYPLECGKIMGGAGFYDSQARLNGAMPLEYTRAERDAYLQQAYDFGVRSFDMESLGFAGFCQHLGIAACEVNAIVVNRFNSDVVAATTEAQTFATAANLVIAYILLYSN